MEVTVAEVTHTVRTGDCLRFRLHGPSRFHCAGPGRARYALLIVLPLTPAPRTSSPRPFPAKGPRP
ncbi:hypothetical protein GA0115253_1066717 [Streptomyces sp. Termitarium-T10T-6]|nr:hypothetical protein GA0115253_1066717 [Streptomyces sp. Termitarium-T10T-6]